jgi:hypothetical protein
MVGKYWLPVVIWITIIFTASSLPVEPPQAEGGLAGFMVFKKLIHVVEYGVLTVLLIRALKKGSNTTKAYWSAIALSALVGAADELHQDFIAGGGTSHLHDVGLDLIGGITAVFILWKLLPKMPEKLRSWAKRLEIL